MTSKLWNQTRRASLIPLAIAALALLPAAAQAAPFPATLAPGEVVSVSGTPNLWIADSQGVLHFVSDPQALAGRAVDWNEQFAINPEQVSALPAGDPWLSTALVRIGEDIYLPQRGASASAPTLRRIQSPADLAALGINASNYGQYVLDPATWEQRYHMSLADVGFDADFYLVPPAAPDMSSDLAHGDGGSSDTSATTIES